MFVTVDVALGSVLMLLFVVVVVVEKEVVEVVVQMCEQLWTGCYVAVGQVVAVVVPVS